MKNLFIDLLTNYNINKSWFQKVAILKFLNAYMFYLKKFKLTFLKYFLNDLQLNYKFLLSQLQGQFSK